MPFLDWVSKPQAARSAQEVPYHLLRQVSAHGDVDGPNFDYPSLGFRESFKLAASKICFVVTKQFWWVE